MLESSDAAVELYLDLLKRCLLNLIYRDPAIRQPWDESSDREYVPFDRDKRLAGADWPSEAHTQIGMRRLDNLQEVVTQVLVAGTPGDLIETGVWRGGSTILMRGILKAHGSTDRTVWVADSFEGFPTSEAQGASARSFSSPEMAAVRGYFEGARQGAVRPIRAPRRPGAVPPGMVPRHAPVRADRAPRGVAPRRRPL
jgi:hypothetical protein